MGNWVSATTELQPITFDGDTIVVTVNRLKTADMSLLAGYMTPDGKMAFSNHLELCKVARGLFPDKVVGIRGMKRADGSEFSAAEFLAVADEFYFSQLVAMILQGLIAVSSVQDVKN